MRVLWDSQPRLFSQMGDGYTVEFTLKYPEAPNFNEEDAGGFTAAAPSNVLVLDFRNLDDLAKWVDSLHSQVNHEWDSPARSQAEGVTP